MTDKLDDILYNKDSYIRLECIKLGVEMYKANPSKFINDAPLMFAEDYEKYVLGVKDDR